MALKKKFTPAAAPLSYEKFTGAPFFIGQPFTEEDRAMISAVASFVPMLSSLLGQHCEIVVHSLEDPLHAVVASANAQLTKREIGAPILEQGLLTLEEKMKEGSEAYFCRSSKGLKLKAGVSPIVNSAGRCLGGLSIALNLDAPFAELLQTWCSYDGGCEQARVFGSGPIDIDAAIDEASRKAELELGPRSRNRAKFIIAELYRQGIFNYRNAVQMVGDRTGVSAVTVYWHLRELKKEEKNSL